MSWGGWSRYRIWVRGFGGLGPGWGVFVVAKRVGEHRGSGRAVMEEMLG